MNIEFLRSFIKLAEIKNFSELAQMLNISQSTLSHRISQIEDEIGGITLIDRSTRKFVLTTAGERFLEYAIKIVDTYDDCLEEVQFLGKMEKEQIDISASTHPGSHILPKSIAQFKANHPNVEFHITINNSKESIEHLKRNEADFAGIGSFMNYKKENFDIAEIGEDNLVFICGRTHEILSKGENIDFDELKKYPFIFREAGSGTRYIVEQEFPKIRELEVKLTINDNDSIISVVSESNYISILSEIIAKKAENAGLIKILHLNDVPKVAQRKIYFIKMKDQKLTKLKKEFWIYISNV